MQASPLPNSMGPYRYAFGIDHKQRPNVVAVPFPADYTADCSSCGRALRGEMINLVEGAENKAWLLSMCDPCLSFAERHGRLYRSYVGFVNGIKRLKALGEGREAARKKRREEEEQKVSSDVEDVYDK